MNRLLCAVAMHHRARRSALAMAGYSSGGPAAEDSGRGDIEVQAGELRALPNIRSAQCALPRYTQSPDRPTAGLVCRGLHTRRRNQQCRSARAQQPCAAVRSLLCAAPGEYVPSTAPPVTVATKRQTAVAVEPAVEPAVAIWTVDDRNKPSS